MSIIRTIRQPLFTLLAVALAWVPAATLAAPERTLLLDPVVVTAEDPSSAPSPLDEDGSARQEA